LKNKYNFTVYYPDNPYLLNVLKSLGTVHMYDKIKAVDYRYLVYNNHCGDFFEFDDFIRILINKEDREFLLAIKNKLANYRFYMDIGLSISFFNGISYKYDDGSEMLLFEVSRSDVLSIKITLRNIMAYTDKIDLFSTKIKNELLNAHNCINCGRCKSPASFIYEGKIIKNALKIKSGSRVLPI
jgi:hypothetical protein